MPSQSADLSFGIASEKTVMTTLGQFLGVELNRNHEYATMDFSNEAKTVNVELKTRRVRHDTYPTALIGLNKIKFCDNPKVEYYFAYSYLDGLFCIKYDKELFDGFETNTNFLRGERDDCINHTQAVMYIPTNLLKRVI